MSLIYRIVYNPFRYIKIRSFFVWFILLLIGLIPFTLLFQSVTKIISFKTIDPIFALIRDISLVNILFVGWNFWLVCRFQLNLRLLFGILPNNYNWLSVIGFIFIIWMFLKGCYYVVNYSISFIVPSYVIGLLKDNNSVLTFHSKTSVPILYNIVVTYWLLILNPLIHCLMFQGILFHRWTFKWGIKRGLLISSLFAALLTYPNFVGIFIYNIVLNLLYIKNRTLIIPVTIQVLIFGLKPIVAELIDLIQKPAKTGYTLDQFRSHVWLGLIYLVLSTPWLIRFIYKNWPSYIWEAPYFRELEDDTVNQQYSDDFQ